MRQHKMDFKLIGTMPHEGSDRLRQELTSRKIDGVVIGFGIRGNADDTIWFEALVDCVRECAPAAKLMFNSAPENAIDAIKRWFPV